MAKQLLKDPHATQLQKSTAQNFINPVHGCEDYSPSGSIQTT
jgi:hypothetical protein